MQITNRKSAPHAEISLTFCLDVGMIAPAPTPYTLGSTAGDSSNSLLTLEGGATLTMATGADFSVLFSDELVQYVFETADKLGADGSNETDTFVTVDFSVDELVSGGVSPDVITALDREIAEGMTQQLIAGWGDDYVALVGASSDANGTYTVTLQHVPEPTTATLSLLALAGLCARRRRK